MTLVIFNYKSNKTSIYYKLFYIKDGLLVPIGFDGLKTDYDEIKQYKKELSGARFVYVSKNYNSTGLPLDIMNALKDKFETTQYIDDFYNGVTTEQTDRTVKAYSR